MATKRTLRTRNRIAEVTPLELWFAADVLLQYPEGESPAAKYLIAPSPQARRQLWERCRDEVLALWAEQRPGQRPRMWWEFEAPEPRQRDGGPPHVPLCDKPQHELGIPYGLSIDRANPPQFESQASYLRRHGLLSREESERLTEIDFEPKVVER
jgi:hypothetical protein